MVVKSVMYLSSLSPQCKLSGSRHHSVLFISRITSAYHDAWQTAGIRQLSFYWNRGMMILGTRSAWSISLPFVYTVAFSICMWFIDIIVRFAGDLGSIPGLGLSSGEGNSYPLQYSGLENSTDCIVHGVAKSQTRLSGFHFHFAGI